MNERDRELRDTICVAFELAPLSVGEIVEMFNRRWVAEHPEQELKGEYVTYEGKVFAVQPAVNESGRCECAVYRMYEVNPAARRLKEEYSVSFGVVFGPTNRYIGPIGSPNVEAEDCYEPEPDTPSFDWSRTVAPLQADAPRGEPFKSPLVLCDITGCPDNFEVVCTREKIELHTGCSWSNREVKEPDKLKLDWSPPELHNPTQATTPGEFLDVPEVPLPGGTMGTPDPVTPSGEPPGISYAEIKALQDDFVDGHSTMEKVNREFKKLLRRHREVREAEAKGAEPSVTSPTTPTHESKVRVLLYGDVYQWSGKWWRITGITYAGEGQVVVETVEVPRTERMVEPCRVVTEEGTGAQ